jgi:hypothetical protein
MPTKHIRLERVAAPSEQDELTIVLAAEAASAYDTSETWRGARMTSAPSLEADVGEHHATK